MKKLLTILALLLVLTMVTSCGGDDPVIGGGGDQPIHGGGEEEFTGAFRFDDVNGECMLVEFYEKNHEGTDVVIPDTYEGKKVTGINGPVFINTNITSLVIPESVEFIPGGLLEGCNKITKLTLPSKGAMAVYDDFSIGGLLFNGEAPESLKEIVINGGEKIAERKFHHCVYIEKITIPACIEEIGYGAFEGCTALSEIVMEEGIKTIGGHAFNSCVSLTEIKFPDTVEFIDYGAFYGCSGLTSIVLPEKLTVIPTYFFEGCTALESITLGANITEICGCAFIDCNAFTTVYFRGTSSDWNKITIDSWMNGPVLDANVYYYSEEGDIFEYVAGNVTWHYDEDGNPVFWEFTLGESLDGKSFAYADSSVSVSDEYWGMILAVKDMGMLEEYFGDDPDHVAIIENSSTKAEYEAGLVGIYAQSANGLSISFSGGKATISIDGQSAMPLEYIEYEGKVYYKLTESIAFYIDSNGNIYEEIATEDFTVNHYYSQQ